MLLFPSMAKANWSDYVIILDPGHGGDDPGAVYNGSTQNNCTESWLVLQCASQVYNTLTGLGANVYMTRYEDDFDGEIDLSPRRAYCYTYDSDVFVSFHLNAANASAHGTETWYYYDGSYNLASCVQNGLISKFGNVDGTGGYEMIDRGIKNNGWTVITAGEAYPSVLTEGLFIDCWSDWQLIQDASGVGFNAWVDGHLKGIYDYLNYYGYYSVTEPPYGGGGGGTSNVPYIESSTDNLYLECEAGSSTTATFTLSGNLLNAWCTVTPSESCADIFHVSPSGITVDGYPNYNFLDGNPTITVTFTPAVSGDYSGEVTFASVGTDGNTVTKTVTLSGRAVEPPLSFAEAWNCSETRSTLEKFGWDASKVRNMDFYNGKLYMVYEQKLVKVVDARTGKWLYDLNNTGVEGGLVALADVRAFDGKIVGCNIAGKDASGNNHDLRIYVWENSTDAPKVTVIDYNTLEENNIVRLGDYIEVGGAWQGIDGSRIIFAYDNYGKVDGVTGGTHIIEFPVADGEIGVTPSKHVEVTASDGSRLYSNSSIRAYPTNYGYMLNGSGCPPTKIKNDVRVDYMSGFKTWGNAYRQFEHNGSTYGLLLDFNDKRFSTTDADGNPAQTDEDAALNITGGHMKLVQVQYAPNDWTYTFFSPKYIASYPSDGLSTTRRNLNCTGNVLVNFYGDKCIEAWLLSTNQGIAYFYAGEMPQGSALNEVAAESSMDAYFDGETLRIKGVKAAKIEVFSIYGAKIAEQTGAQQVALNAAAAGVYLVRVADTQGKVSVAKVLKK